MEKNPQELTNEIAEKSGLQTNLRQFYDPLYIAAMIGSFLRKLYHSSKHPFIKILVGFIVFMLPAIVLGTITASDLLRSENDAIYNAISALLVIVIYFIVGLKLFVSGLKDLANSKRK